MNKYDGYVLLMVMIILQLITWMMTFSLGSLRKETQLLYRNLENDMFMTQATRLMHSIEVETLREMPSCIIPLTSTETLRRAGDEFWVAKACHGNALELYYAYVIENMDTDPCGVIGSQPVTLDFYRITLRINNSPFTDGIVMLQSTLAKKSSQQLSCAEALHQASVGVQMRRQL